MHSYTHGGVQLVARRFSENNMVHEPDVEEVNSLFRLLLIIALVSFTEILMISGNESKDDDVQSIYSMIIKEHFDGILL